MPLTPEEEAELRELESLEAEFGEEEFAPSEVSALTPEEEAELQELEALEAFESVAIDIDLDENKTTQEKLSEMVNALNVDFSSGVFDQEKFNRSNRVISAFMPKKELGVIRDPQTNKSKISIVDKQVITKFDDRNKEWLESEEGKESQRLLDRELKALAELRQDSFNRRARLEQMGADSAESIRSSRVLSGLLGIEQNPVIPLPEKEDKFGDTLAGRTFETISKVFDPDETTEVGLLENIGDKKIVELLPFGRSFDKIGNKRSIMESMERLSSMSYDDTLDGDKLRIYDRHLLSEYVKERSDEALKDKTTLAKASDIITDMIPLMGEMYLGGGLAKGILGGTAGLTNIFAKIANVIGRGGIVTSTFGLPSVGADAVDRLEAKGFGFDKNGKFIITEDGDDLGDAFTNAFISNTISNAIEIGGGESVVAVLNKVGNKISSKLTGTALGRATEQFSRLRNSLMDFFNSKSPDLVNRVLSKAEWDGFLAEFMEERLESIAQFMAGTTDKWSDAHRDSKDWIAELIALAGPGSLNAVNKAISTKEYNDINESIIEERGVEESTGVQEESLIESFNQPTQEERDNVVQIIADLDDVSKAEVLNLFDELTDGRVQVDPETLTDENGVIPDEIIEIANNIAVEKEIDLQERAESELAQDELEGEAGRIQGQIARATDPDTKLRLKREQLEIQDRIAQESEVREELETDQELEKELEREAEETRIEEEPVVEEVEITEEPIEIEEEVDAEAEREELGEIDIERPVTERREDLSQIEGRKREVESIKRRADKGEIQSLEPLDDLNVDDNFDTSNELEVFRNLTGRDIVGVSGIESSGFTNEGVIYVNKDAENKQQVIAHEDFHVKVEEGDAKAQKIIDDINRDSVAYKRFAEQYNGIYDQLGLERPSDDVIAEEFGARVWSKEIVVEVKKQIKPAITPEQAKRIAEKRAKTVEARKDVDRLAREAGLTKFFNKLNQKAREGESISAIKAKMEKASATPTAEFPQGRRAAILEREIERLTQRSEKFDKADVKRKVKAEERAEALKKRQKERVESEKKKVREVKEEKRVIKEEAKEFEKVALESEREQAKRLNQTKKQLEDMTFKNISSEARLANIEEANRIIGEFMSELPKEIRSRFANRITKIPKLVSREAIENKVSELIGAMSYAENVFIKRQALNNYNKSISKAKKKVASARKVKGVIGTDAKIDVLDNYIARFKVAPEATFQKAIDAINQFKKTGRFPIKMPPAVRKILLDIQNNDSYINQKTALEIAENTQAIERALKETRGAITESKINRKEALTVKADKIKKENKIEVEKQQHEIDKALKLPRMLIYQGLKGQRASERFGPTVRSETSNRINRGADREFQTLESFVDATKTFEGDVNRKDATRKEVIEINGEKLSKANAMAIYAYSKSDIARQDLYATEGIVDNRIENEVKTAKENLKKAETKLREAEKLDAVKEIAKSEKRIDALEAKLKTEKDSIKREGLKEKISAERQEIIKFKGSKEYAKFKKDEKLVDIFERALIEKEQKRIDAYDKKIKSITDKLTSEEKKTVTDQIKYFEDVVYPLANEEAYRPTHNGVNMPKRENYFPLVNIDRMDKPQTIDINSFQNFGQLNKRGIEEGFTKETSKERVGFKTLSGLNYFTIVDRANKNFSRYIGNALELTEAHRFINDKTIKRTLQSKDPALYDFLKSWVDDVVGGRLNKIDQTSEMKRRLNLMGMNARKNYQLAVLGGVTKTIPKQIPSFTLVLPFTTHRQLAKTTANVMTDYAKSIGRPSKSESIQKMEKKSTFIRRRKGEINRTLVDIQEQIAKHGGVIDSKTGKLLAVKDDVKQFIGEYGMKPIQYADTWAVAIGWNAVYDQSINDGMTESQAVEKADNAIRKTQPVSGVIDAAGWQRTGQFISSVTPFSSQTSQIYNMWADVIDPRSGLTKAERIKSVEALMFNSMVINAINVGKLGTIGALTALAIGLASGESEDELKKKAKELRNSVIRDIDVTLESALGSLPTGNLSQKLKYKVTKGIRKDLGMPAEWWRTKLSLSDAGIYGSIAESYYNVGDLLTRLTVGKKKIKTKKGDILAPEIDRLIDEIGKLTGLPTPSLTRVLQQSDDVVKERDPRYLFYSSTQLNKQKKR